VQTFVEIGSAVRKIFPDKKINRSKA